MNQLRKIDRENIEDIIAMTPMQEGLLFHYLQDPGSDYYFEQLSLDISGEIDMYIFEKAWNFVIETNEMLRTVFRWQDVENPVQIILKAHHISPGYDDFSREKPAKRQKRLEAVIFNDREKKFDLQDVPFRISLFKLEMDKYRVIISNHHILYDGWSNGIILKEFLKAYDDLSKGQDPGKPEKTRFKEFIHWVRVQDMEGQEKYWRSYLEGIETGAQLPVKRKKSVQVNHNKTYCWKQAREKTAEITGFLKKHQLTLASLLYTAWGILLQKYHNSDDVLFGTTVSGRSAKLAGIEEMVGLFINTLPLRTWSGPHEKAVDLLRRMERDLHLRQNHEHSSLVNIRKWSETGKSQELFDTLIILENYPLENRLTEESKGLSIDTFSIFEMTHYDLTVSISIFAEIEVKVIYPGDLFEDKSIERLVGHFAGIVETLMENPGQLTAEIEIISKEEKKKLLYDFNDTQAEYPAHKTIHRLFAEQVERTPDHTALLGPQPGTREGNNRSHWSGMSYISITYRELHHRSQGMARILIGKGSKPGTIAGIMVERSIEMIVGILGILKAGGAYMPIDPAYPQERKQYMINDSKPVVLLTAPAINEALNRSDKSHMSYNSPGPAPAPHHPPSTSTLTCRVSPANLAYIIYTSGTTGTPKGVMVEHSSVVNILVALQKEYPLQGTDAYLLKTSYVFDVSVTELFGWYLGGGRLVILEKEGEKNPGKIMETVERTAVTHMNFVPSMFHAFTGELTPGNVGKLSTLKYIFLAGEALQPGVVKKFRRLNTSSQLENIYGPTEGTVYTARCSLSGWDGKGDIPIGKPLPNIRLYILDKDNRMQPPGLRGELYISGVCLARGYINRPGLTAEKFDHDLWDLPDHQDENNKKLLRGCPDASRGGFLEKNPPGRRRQKIYHTGDLARWQTDGNIEFLGRIDSQVKIRGFRVELEEIESCLSHHEAIKEAVVMVREGAHGENHLCAFIIAGRDLAVPELKTYLAEKLPAYMIPAYFKQIERIPLTSSGKIDRKALLSTGTARELETGAVYVTAVSEMEKTIAGIWKELVETEKFGVHDNFFDIGGNSLTIIRLNSRLKKAFARDIPMAAMFTYPTIFAMAAYLRGRDKDKAEPGTGREMQTGKKGLEIAIIGMSCRFPGAKNIHEYWENIKNGSESIVFFSREELNQQEHDAELMKDRHYIPAKAILTGKEYFDAAFFDYTPAEAGIMDPQMRLFHEICWEVLEDAGYDPGTYDGRIGLYAGASSNPLWAILPLSSKTDFFQQWGDMQLSDKDYTGTRVGYKLGLKGPCITLQTACSTSLAAVDLASQGLLHRACEMALAGGVSITMHDEPGYRYREGAIMSRDGHCRPFDARATGTLGGNGAGVVVLKSLEQAIRDRDHIYAVIKSTAVNNDGKNRVGFTAPGVEGQANVIRDAIQKAGIEPGSIGYIETHGTGTGLGDPIEIEGLKQAFKSLTGASPGREQTCALGSVKANIGHLDAAAGIAGMIKTVLAIKHGLIPPSLHFETLNPDIDLENTPFYINTRLTAWKNDVNPRRAGVSSFGIGGTNAQVVLEEWPADSESVSRCVGESVGQWVSEPARKTPGGTGGLAPLPGAPLSNRQYQLILLSARTETALDKMTQNLAEYLKENLLNPGNHVNPMNPGHLLNPGNPGNPTNPGQILADAAYTLQVGRKAFKYRRKLVCNHLHEVIDSLTSPEPWKVNTFFSKEETSPVIFMFSGLGSQYVDMGLELYLAEPVFHEEMDRCFRILKPMLGYDLKDILYPGISVSEVSEVSEVRGSNRHHSAGLTGTGGSPLERSAPQGRGVSPGIDQIEIAQLVVFIIEYVLARLLMRWGITPEAMIGYSFGEYAAACLSGVFSLEDALKVIVSRGKLLTRVSGGAMLSIPLSHPEVTPLLTGELSVAIDNGLSCIVAGPGAAIAAFEKKMKQKKLLCMPVTHSLAMHSQMVEPILTKFEEELKKITLNPPQIPYISNVTGTWLTAAEAVTTRYWKEHLRKTVRFAEGITELMKQPRAVFIEIGPARDLSTMVKRFMGDNTGHKIVNLIRPSREKVPDVYYLLNHMGNLWLYGVNIDWTAFTRGREANRIPLPTYPFEGKTFPVHPGSLPLSLSTGRQAQQNSLTANRKTSVSDWFYTPVWELALPGDNREPASHDYEPDNWLVFIDETGFGQALIRHWQEMKKQTAQVITVRIGSAFAGVGHSEFIINPKQGNDYDRLFLQLKKMQKVPAKIVHLWGISEENSRDPLDDFESCLDRGFFSILEIVQALDRQHITGKIQVEIVTNGMHEVTGEEFIQPAAAAIKAAIKVIPLEYDNISCRGIDIVKPVRGSAKEDELARRLAREFTLNAEYPGNITAIRGNHCWEQTLKPIRLEQQHPIPKRLKQGGVYLVSGGLGGIGLTLAEYLARSIKPKLILVGRSPFPGKEQWDQWLSTHHQENDISRKINTLRRMEALGAEIMVAVADISDHRQMDPVMSRAVEKFKTIDGIVHAAGVADTYGIIRTRTRQMTENVMAPKVKGTIVLDRLLTLKKIEPDFILLFSTLANAAPEVNFGQVGYSAANEFLDAYACYKTTAAGIFTVSINWPAWEEKGMWAKAAAQWDEKSKNMDNPAFQAIFANTLSPLQGIDVFGRILDSQPLPLKRAAVSPVDLTVYLRQCRELRAVVKQETGNKTRGRRQKHPRPGLTTPYAAPGNKTQQALTDLFQEFFGIEKIGIKDNFFELGGDSLKAVNLAARIYKNLDIEIPLAEIFNRPTSETLAQYIMEKAGITVAQQDENPHIYIGAGEEKEYYDLSYAQRRLWVLCQFEHDSTAYNIPMAQVISGEFHSSVFIKAGQALAHRHESLRTIFIQVDGSPRQKVVKDFTFGMKSIDLRELEPGEREKKAREIYIEDAQRPFDLQHGPLFRFTLVRLAEKEYVLIFNIHHIVNDGWSQGIINNEIIRLYNAFLEETSGKNFLPSLILPALPLQYRDYTRWHHRCIETGLFAAARQYWLEKLKDKPNGIQLPQDYPRPPVQTFNGGRITRGLDKERTRQLHQTGLDHDATLFMSLLTLLNIFLYKYSGQADIITGVPIAGRGSNEFHPLVGFLVNTLVYRCRVNPDHSCKQLLAAVKEETLTCYRHQYYPFDRLVEELELERDLSQAPLFNVMLALNNAATRDNSLTMKGLEISRYVHTDDYNMSKFDLGFFFDEIDGQVWLQLEYNSDLFKQPTIRQMAENFLTLIENVTRDIQAPVSTLSCLAESEYRRVIHEFNHTSHPFPPQSLQELLEKQAEVSKDKTALVYNEEHISYGELNSRSNRYAHYLKEDHGIIPNRVIGISMDRSLRMICVLLGIIKSGGAYLAVDPAYPRERVLHVLADSQAGLLITDMKRPGFITNSFQKHAKKTNVCLNPDGFTDSEASLLMGGGRRPLFEDYPGKIIEIGPGEEEIIGKSPGNPPRVNQPGDILYVNYTSGSTGMPNGAMLSHGLLANLIHWQREKSSIDCSLRCLQFTTINFCVSFQEILGTLTSGGQLELIGEVERQDIDYLMDFLSRRQIENLFLPFSYLNFLFTETSRWHECFRHNLKHIVTAGEQLKVTPGLKAFLERNPWIKLHNHYGSTEMHVVTSYTLDASTAARTPIPPAGKPIGNTRIYILDEYFNPVPVGVWGEIFAAGTQEFTGYINNTSLTEKKLVAHSQLPPGEHKIRLYRTGDLGRWQANGNIEYKGRKDLMVKIRGFRVELGEIETRLLAHPKVKEATVIVGEGSGSVKYLCAYMVAKTPGTGKIDPLELREYLANHLPDYMIPSYFLQLDRIPLTPNGKVDKEALPAPGIHEQKVYAPPRDNTEKKLQEIWANVLGMEKEKIGINDNFFHLGGHSLKATVLVSRIYKELAVKVPLTEVFITPSIRALASFVREAEKQKFFSINPVEKREYYILSSAQRRLFILQRMDEQGIGYNMPAVWQVEGNFDVKKFEAVFQRLTRRHESLRTSFHLVNDEPVQRIEAIREPPQSKVFADVSRRPGGRFFQKESREASDPPEAIIKSFIRPFDLSHAPLFRVDLLKQHEQQHILMVDMHHIISDGLSIGILAKEFMELYAGMNLSGLRLQYKDFSQWQNRQTRTGLIKQQEIYWLNQFSGEIPALELPADYTRPLEPDFAGQTIHFDIDKEETAALKSLARDREVTLFMLLLSLYNIFLYKLSGQEDIVVGTPIASRGHTDLEGIIGMFVNTLALRNFPVVEKTFNQFLTEIKENTLKAFENQDYLYEDLVEKVKVERDTGRNPLFDTMFTFQNMDTPPVQIPGLKLSPYHYENRVSKFDLTLTALEIEDCLDFTIEYCIRLFKEETIRRFAGFFKKAVSFVLDNDEAGISGLEIITREEKNRILLDFNNTKVEYPRDKTIHRLFQEQVERTPDQMALLGPGHAARQGNYRGHRPYMSYISITYRELNNRSNGLAYILTGKGVKLDNIVGIMAERSIELIIGILGILKAGGAYLPIDPDYPQKRIDYMLKDSGARIFLKKSGIRNPKSRCFQTIPNDPNLNDQNKRAGVTVLDFEHLNFEFVSNFEFSASNFLSTSLAYVIYTSGSTGRPKGVLIGHRGLCSLDTVFKDKFNMNRRDRVGQFANITFDASAWEIFMAILNGAALYLLHPAVIKDYESFHQFLNTGNITVITLPPPYALQLRLEELRTLRLMVTAGSSPSREFIKKCLGQSFQYINAYGPTENTICTTYWQAGDASCARDTVITIGKPISNTKCRVMDKNMRHQPIGAAGELCISGEGLARGYLNNPELTFEKFCLRRPGGSFCKNRPLDPRKNFLFEGTRGLAPLPDREAPGKKDYRSHKSHMSYIYRTGDLARWLPDGNIEFLGRSDNQVKIRGFRIEPGEIESRLSQHGNIKEAAVIDRTDSSGEKYLCAYVVYRKPNDGKPTELKAYLSQTLPQYMIPAHFLEIENIPLNPSGKVDRNKLPEPGARPGNEYVAPETDREREIAEVWKQVLGLENVGIYDNFFDTGGNSLKIINLTIELKKRLGIELSTAKMFQYTTIASQAKYIARANEKEKQEAGVMVELETGKVKNRLKQKRDKSRL